MISTINILPGDPLINIPQLNWIDIHLCIIYILQSKRPALTNVRVLNGECIALSLSAISVSAKRDIFQRGHDNNKQLDTFSYFWDLSQNITKSADEWIIRVNKETTIFSVPTTGTHSSSRLHLNYDFSVSTRTCNHVRV